MVLEQYRLMKSVPNLTYDVNFLVTNESGMFLNIKFNSQPLVPPQDVPSNKSPVGLSIVQFLNVIEEPSIGLLNAFINQENYY